MTYAKAAKMFCAKMGTEGDGEVTLLKNTTLTKVNKSYVVSLYHTPIVTILPNGSFRLTTDGKFTNLTKSRMEKYSPVKLKQVDGWWFVVDDKEKVLSVFYERILINKDGKPIKRVGVKSPLFKKIKMILDKILDQASDYRISEIMSKRFKTNGLKNLIETLNLSPKKIRSMFFYYGLPTTLNFDRLISDMLERGGIKSYNSYANMSTNVFKSRHKLITAYYIPYIMGMLKFTLKQSREKVDA